jgi:hypothetical protein
MDTDGHCPDSRRVNRHLDSVFCATVNCALPSLGAIMNPSMKLSLVASILPLLILTSYSSGTSAQTATPAPIVASDSGATTPAVVAPGPAAKAPARNGTGVSAPVGNGRWVNRIDKKTCPNGSTAYVDERDGGVKCWVNDK